VLREHRALAVDHAVRRAALLAKVHHRVGPEAGEGLGEELPVADVAHLEVDVVAADLAPPARGGGGWWGWGLQGLVPVWLRLASVARGGCGCVQKAESGWVVVLCCAVR